MQMQQANLELLRGSAGAAAAGPLAPGTPTAAEMFGNIAAFYGLPNSGAGTASTPATTAPPAAVPAAASTPAATGPGIGGGGGSGVGISAFSNNGPSAFSPIQPLHSAGIAAATAFGAQRQPSDAWNVRNCPIKVHHLEISDLPLKCSAFSTDLEGRKPCAKEFFATSRPAC